ncbi:antitoxin VapB family protein [Halalkalicoccus sp. NIPERK01]|uniref:antitoxin VapB family protein n=1 Tax=Halalkalicoccus sp. NIPERK01 TaxID=3053469 RepID=UPI00256ED112|nr:antitoxin VapB family protein [Halalkalicoccus sp. NIPERK01]MDL5363435.1 antitoxin VapB family protein [Halalkalicoccus sp. NIPERK01]
MSKNIAISDEVYEALKREKGERSFSEVIEAKLETGGKIADVTGAKILERETSKAVTDDIGRMSRGTVARIDETTDDRAR